MRIAGVLFVLVWCGFALPASAQQNPQAAAPDAGVGAQRKPAAQPAKPGVPDDLKLIILIRTALIALNQANLTGNYSVLRDIAAPSFQQANNPARLGEIFADLRVRKIDLSPITAIDPKLARAAFVNDQGMLRITGFFLTKPEQVNFDLAFQPVDGQWRLFGISVNTPSRPSLQSRAIRFTCARRALVGSLLHVL
jgi:hypothetical protein